MGSSSPPELTAVLTAAARDDQATIDLLHGLVAIPSLSGGEAEAVDYLCREMRARGFEAGPDAAGSAVGVIGNGRRRVVLLGHIDTVPGEISVRIEDGVLHGRGAVDAKGPLATFVAAATAAAERADATITVVGAVGEESIGSPGANAVKEWLAPDFCLIGEPSGWDAVCLGYRGTFSFTYRLEEAGRHTAGPGESVSEQAVAFWNALTAEVATRNGEVTGFHSLGQSLRGMWSESDGLSDVARLSIGVRLPPGIDVDEFEATVRALAEPGELIVHGRQHGYATDKRSPIVPPFLRSIRAAGGTPRFTRKLGTSDMTVVGPVWNCPIVAYGPGDASLDHTPEERIVLDEYLKAVQVLTDVLVAL